MSNRHANGQFKKGHSGNPGGRARKDREVRYYEILQSVCTFEVWRAIGEKAAEQAEAGDGVARKWLSDYLIGPPTQSHDIKTQGEVEIRVTYGDGSYRKSEAAR